MGAIRVGMVDGVWWFLDHRGRPFVSIGVNHLQPDCWLAPYNRQASIARYGEDLAIDGKTFNPRGEALPRLVDSVITRIQSWGFNTLGMHTHGVPSRFYRDRMVYLKCIHAYHLGSRFRFDRDRFPDLYADDVVVELSRRIERCCRCHRDSPHLLGYVFSDIPRWYFFAGERRGYPETTPVHPWIDDLRNRPATSAGKQAWVGLLRRRYPDVAAAADAYGVTARRWEALAERREWPQPTDRARVRADTEAFLAQLVDRWYQLHTRFIRQFDPDHLIFGDKLHSPDILPEWFFPILQRSVDVVLIQWYKPFDQQKATLQHLHDRIGRPIVNGDGCFGCPKPPHQTRVKGYPCQSTQEAALAYQDYLDGIMGLPFMLGWHHCGLMEQWDGGKPAGVRELNENGLMDPFERPYPELVRAVTEANTRAHDIHRRSARRLRVRTFSPDIVTPA